MSTTYAYISKFRDLVFCSYLPFPTAIGFVIEEVGGRKYGNHVMTDALDALYTIANAANSRRNRIADAESRMARTVSKLANYHSRYESDELFDKYGLYRMLTYGYRPHFSFRTVITSIHDEHSYDEVQLPWSVAVMMMKLHIANKLLRRGKSPNEIFSLISENILRTHPTLTEIFDELIEESPNSKGIPLIFTRYPSLLHGSTQLFWCKHIKKDPADVSTALSVLVLSAYNADFDGDYMSGQILLDNRFVEFFKRMEPHTGLMSLDKPFRVSNHAKQPEPVLHTLNHRIRLCDQRAIER